jgi:hypothetical protein
VGVLALLPVAAALADSWLPEGLPPSIYVIVMVAERFQTLLASFVVLAGGALAFLAARLHIEAQRRVEQARRTRETDDRNAAVIAELQIKAANLHTAAALIEEQFARKPYPRLHLGTVLNTYIPGTPTIDESLAKPGSFPDAFHTQLFLLRRLLHQVEAKMSDWEDDSRRAADLHSPGEASISQVHARWLRQTAAAVEAMTRQLTRLRDGEAADEEDWPVDVFVRMWRSAQTPPERPDVAGAQMSTAG